MNSIRARSKLQCKMYEMSIKYENGVHILRHLLLHSAGIIIVRLRANDCSQQSLMTFRVCAIACFSIIKKILEKFQFSVQRCTLPNILLLAVVQYST